MRPIVVIPARMESSRLPGKPLAVIAGEPMIVQVWRRGLEADLGPVIVAAGDQCIVDAIVERGGRAVLTDPGLPSGSDRVAAALAEVDPGARYDTVVNLQGDMPTADPLMLRTACEPLENAGFDMSTLACAIRDPAELARTSVVKIAMEAGDASGRRGRAVYFSRSPIPHGASTFLHHIGLYVYRRAALARYVAAPPGSLERTERLEQLRALALGLAIAITVVEVEPLGVDTEDDLEEARRRLAHRGQLAENRMASRIRAPDSAIVPSEADRRLPRGPRRASIAGGRSRPRLPRERRLLPST
jgi:3-deoxy-manno-octulosonate cytidylyltransferase (CMP-KDO synthetase)